MPCMSWLSNKAHHLQAMTETERKAEIYEIANALIVEDLLQTCELHV